jgi:GT2 family glycosyltransferase
MKVMQAKEPRVGIVMITHNRCAQVLETLRHLTRLVERPRIVVVDNASEDKTDVVVAREFSQVEVIQAGANLGAAGRTLGVQHLDVPYIAFGDDDTWWAPGCLQRAADLFDAHPRLAIVTARVLVGSEEREDPTCAELQRSPLPRDKDMPGPLLLGFLAGASMVRRAAFLETGGFEPRLFIGGEEELLAVDLAARGWRLCYVPELTVYHYPCPQRDVQERRWHLVRNKLWFYWLRRPLSTALRQTLQAAREAPRCKASRWGLLTALRGAPWVLAQRRVLPRRVENGLRLLEGRI